MPAAFITLRMRSLVGLMTTPLLSPIGIQGNHASAHSDTLQTGGVWRVME